MAMRIIEGHILIPANEVVDLSKNSSGVTMESSATSPWLVFGLLKAKGKERELRDSRQVYRRHEISTSSW